MTETEHVQQADLNDLTYFWLPNGAPCFVADREDICEQAEGLGFQIYYLIANQEKQKSTSSKQSTTNLGGSVTTYTYEQKEYTANIMKVVKNIVGRAISVCDEDFGKEFTNLKEEATYSLPPIPRIMVDKLDEFFRLVDAQHGTESIVMLTFDPTKEDSDGWGILVPDQTNTSTHCKYDPDSVAILKEDHVLIVGSVHSHPGMSAYASGTDHQDQADFDGLHITFGWQSAVSNGLTQYHAELQMGGTAFILNIDDVFESYKINKEPDPEVVGWTEKVKKVTAPALGAHGTTTPSTLNSGTNQPAFTGVGTINEYGYNSSNRFVQTRRQIIPQIVKDSIPYNAVLVAEIDTRETSRMLCPACGTSLFRNEIYIGSSCPSCDIPVVSSNSHVNSIVNSVNGYLFKRHKEVNVPYYLWSRGHNNGQDHAIMLIKDQYEEHAAFHGNKSLKEIIYDTDDAALQHDLRKDLESNLRFDNERFADPEDEMEYWGTHTWCCQRDIFSDHPITCECTEVITDDTAMEFDQFCFDENLEVYGKEADCESCFFMYTGGCDGYRQSVVDYKRASHKPKDVIIDYIEQNLNLMGCEKWNGYKAEIPQVETMETEVPYDNVY